MKFTRKGIHLLAANTNGNNHFRRDLAKCFKSQKKAYIP